MKRIQGFTLIELLVVISIIAALSSVVLASLNTARIKARDVRRFQDIAQIKNALELYRNDNGAYPLSGGAYAPNGAWTNSNDTSWNNLATALLPHIKVLPQDPKQTPSDTTTGPWPPSGANSYSYFSNTDSGCTGGQWYILIFRTEGATLPSPGVKRCDGSTYNPNSNNAVVGGVSQVQ
jgi:general secretion pathway protein G